GAALGACVTGAFGSAYEARGYGLMLGLFALTLYCWSEAVRGRRRSLNLFMMGVALAAGVWTHYYTAFVVIPIVAGEVVRFASRGKPDWGIVASLALSGLAIAPLLTLV